VYAHVHYTVRSSVQASDVEAAGEVTSTEADDNEDDYDNDDVTDDAMAARHSDSVRSGTTNCKTPTRISGYVLCRLRLSRV